MKVTAIAQAVRNPERVNVSVDGTFRFSLDVAQLLDLKIKVGNEYTEAELAEIETESQFGKLYARALEYCLMRPHSKREVRDYLWKKTRETKYRSRKTGEIKLRPGISETIADRVFARLGEKGYLDDEKFSSWWVETRGITKGTSLRKLYSELSAKGVSREIIERTLLKTNRSDASELEKMIARKRSKYPDEQKLIAYLARQGFRYDDIKQALTSDQIY